MNFSSKSFFSKHWYQSFTAYSLFNVDWSFHHLTVKRWSRYACLTSHTCIVSFYFVGAVCRVRQFAPTTELASQTQRPAALISGWAVTYPSCSVFSHHCAPDLLRLRAPWYRTIHTLSALPSSFYLTVCSVPSLVVKLKVCLWRRQVVICRQRAGFTWTDRMSQRSALSLRSPQ